MKHSISITSPQKDVAFPPALRARLKRAVKKTLELEEFPYPAQVFISVVDAREIQRLNGEYRGKDAPTDVLSFPVIEDIGSITDADRDFSRGGEVLLGDVILCASVIRDQAPEFSHSFEEECVYMTVHSVLHLLGYDHIKEEERKLHFARQDEIYRCIEKEEEK